MKKPIAFTAIALFAALLTSGVSASEYGTADEAKAMLDRVVAAMTADPVAALAKFNAGEDGFRDRDLYPFCNDASGIIRAHPTLVGQQISDVKDVDGKMVGEAILKAAEAGKTAEVEYKWPRPGSDESHPKVSFVTKIGDYVCGVGYYK
jgi:signal transduction histidine kinase